MTSPAGPQDGYNQTPGGYPQQPTPPYQHQQPAPGQPQYQQPAPPQQYQQPAPPQQYQQPAPGQWGWGGPQGPAQPVPPQVLPPQGQPPKAGHAVRNALIIVGAVVLVAVAGLGFALHLAGNKPKAAAAMTVAWAVKATEDTQAGDHFAGSWSTPDTVLDGRTDGVIAYSLNNGAQVWGWQVPSGNQGCSMSANTGNGIGVFAYGTEGCDQLMAFNVNTGKQMWPHAISVTDPNPKLLGQPDPYESVDGNVMAVQTPGNTIGAYDLTTGKKLWQTSNPNSSTSPSCTVYGTAVIGSTVYGLYNCISADGNTEYFSLLGYNAQTGAKTWTGQTSRMGEFDSGRLWSDPTNGYLFVEDTTTSLSQSLLSFSVPGGSGPTTATSIDLDPYDTSAAFSPIGPSSGQYLPRGYAVHGHTLYIQGANGDDSIANNVNAIDLATGKKLWTQAIPGDTMTIVNADANGVHTVVSKGVTSPFQLVALSSATGTKTYGASINDGRVHIETQDMAYLEGGYLVDLPGAVTEGQPELYVLKGATAS